MTIKRLMYYNISASKNIFDLASIAIDFEFHFTDRTICPLKLCFLLRREHSFEVCLRSGAIVCAFLYKVR